MLKIYFIVKVFGKVALVAGPLPSPNVCIALAQNFQVDAHGPVIVMDGKIVKPEDYAAECWSVPSDFRPPLDHFDFETGHPT